MTAHTPGPWQYDADSEAVFVVLDGGQRDQDICLIDTTHEDGRLVAAAPDLLAALREMMAPEAKLHLKSDVPMEVLVRAHAAILKAEGKS